MTKSLSIKDSVTSSKSECDRAYNDTAETTSSSEHTSRPSVARALNDASTFYAGKNANTIPSSSRYSGLFVVPVISAASHAITALATGHSPKEAAQIAAAHLPGSTIAEAFEQDRTTEAVYRTYEATGIGILGTEPMRLANDIAKLVRGYGFEDLDPGLITKIAKANIHAATRMWQEVRATAATVACRYREEAATEDFWSWSLWKKPTSTRAIDKCND